jgi:hypothetical protein
MPDEAPTVDVPIPVEAGVAVALGDAATRARVGRLVSRMLRPPSLEGLGAAIAALKAEAHRRGLTDEIVDEELAAHKTERRAAPPQT